MASFRKVEAWALVVGLACAVGGVGSVAWSDDARGELSTAWTGEVVRASGEAVANAEVFATCDAEADADSSPPTSRARTDAAGRFRIDWPTPALGDGIASLWAYHPGLGVARLRVACVRPASASPVRLSLAPLPAEAAATVRVIGSRGDPAGGVRICPRFWYEGGLAAESAHQERIPPELATLLAVVTDAEGRATFPDLAALHLAGLTIEVPGASARQLAEWEPGWSARARSVRLRDVGLVVGQIRGEDDGPRAGWSVAGWTRVEGRIGGIATATTDPSGGFTLQGVAAGPLEVHAEPPAGADEVATRTTYRPSLLPGRTAAVEIRARRGARVAGRVVDRESGGPVTGAWVVLGGPDAPDRRVDTDADGRFASVLPNAPDRVRVAVAPPPYLVPLSQSGAGGRLGTSGPAPDDLILPLDRGLMLRGSIERPIGGAADVEVSPLTVRARWDERDAQGRSHAARSRVVGVAADRTFVVGPVPPGVEVKLGVSLDTDGSTGPEVRVVAAPDGEPIRLTGPNRVEVTTLVGRVVGPGGSPVAGALVQFRVGPAGPEARSIGDQSGHRVTAGGLDAVVTDLEGRFQRTVRLGANLGDRWRWSAAVEGEGAAGPIVTEGDGPENEVVFPTIALSRGDDGPPLVGRVEGSDGQAIAGASVRDLAGSRTITDALGQFQLAGLGRNSGVPPILVVESVGHRCSGTVIPGEAGRDGRPLVLTLTRLDEPTPSRPDRPAPTPAEETLEAEIGRILARHDSVALASLVEHLAEARPERAANLLQAGAITDPRVADGLRGQVAWHLAGLRGPDAAEAILDAIEAPDARAHARLAVVAVASPRLPADRRISLVEQAERDARSTEDLRARVVALGEVAGAWLDLGQADRARILLGEAEAGADSLPRATAGAAAWSSLAPTLARIDPARARARLNALIDPRLADRGRLATARALGRTDPAEAARFFREVRNGRLACGAIAEIAHRIASRDARLARSLVDSIHDRYPVEAAHALGMLAHALAPTDRVEATALLRLAFDRLATSAHAGRVAQGPNRPAEPSHVASSLLPVAEAIDPGLIPEFAWRAVALHDARPGSGPTTPGRHCSTAVLAVLLHRYDPALALGLFNPARFDPASIPAADLDPLLLAIARLAPHLAGQWVAATSHLNVRDRHLALLVAALTPSQTRPESRDARYLLHLWAPTQGPTRP